MERDLGASLELCHSKIDDNLEKVEEQDTKFENWLNQWKPNWEPVVQLNSESMNLKKKLSLLEEQSELSEKYSRINCVDIFGLP